MGKYTKIVALDQHQDPITVAAAGMGPDKPRLYGLSTHTRPAVLAWCCQHPVTPACTATSAPCLNRIELH